MACGAADANVNAAMAATSEFEIVAESMLKVWKVYVCAGWGSHWGGGMGMLSFIPGGNCGRDLATRSIEQVFRLFVRIGVSTLHHR